MSANPDSVVGQGEFHDSIKPSKPLTHKGHQIGQQVGHEAIPEFHAQTYPPGSAPKEHTFNPNPESSVPGQALNDNMDPSMRSGALDMPGATSKSVYDKSTFSRPMEGQTSREVRSNRAGRHGLEGVGASTPDETIEGVVRAKGADLPEGIGRGVKAKMEKSEGGYEAQQRIPASADEVASEMP